MSESLNVLMVGVGGQGTVMASDILADAALTNGFEVKKSDALGMSQRGGSVVSHVRIGAGVFSPLVKKGDADILVGFEKLEAARWALHLRTDALAIINNQAIPPFSVSSGSEKYPLDELVLQLLHEKTSRVHMVEGVALAQQAGSAKALNAAILGYLSAHMEIISKEIWIECLSRALPPKLLDLNLLAFESGRKASAAASGEAMRQITNR